MWFGFLLSTIFIPDISGAATTPRWAFAAIVLPMMLGQSQFRLTRAHLAGLALLWYAAITLSWTVNVYDGLDALIKLMISAVAFVYGSNLVSLRPIIIGFGLGMWMSSLVILTGLDVPHTTDNAGLFVNSNSMGEIAGLVLVAVLFYRSPNDGSDRGVAWFRFLPLAFRSTAALDRSPDDSLRFGAIQEKFPELSWLIPGILPAFVLSHSRGAFIAVAVCWQLWLWQRSRLLAIALGAVAVALIVLSGSLGSIHDRLTLWGDILPHLSLLGSGIGSFYTLYPIFGSIDTLIQRPEHLHNDWLEFAFETGAVGFVILLYCAGALYSRSGVVSRAVLTALGVEACFGFPLHMAATAVLGAIVAGHAAVRGAVLRDPVADGGMGIRRWLFPDLSGIGS